MLSDHGAFNRQAAMGAVSLSTSAASGGRSVTLVLTKVLLLLIAQLPAITASPTPPWAKEDSNGTAPSDPSLWLYLSVALALVLGGGAFAGLTIALMGQVSYRFCSRTTSVDVSNGMPL
jgi:hypothetical protein